MGTGLNIYKGKWTGNEAVHLLKRTMFGAKKTDVDHCASLSLSAAVDELLTVNIELKYLPVNHYDQFGNNIPPGKTWINAPYNKEEDEKRIQSFQMWTIGMFIDQDRSIREKMTLFWHNHFATDVLMEHSDLIWKHHKLLRENAVGNFRELAEKITVDAHMLRYLNGEYNTNKAPNENYARELQELFCVGKDSAEQYSEEDIKQAARILTGWKVDKEKGISYFDAASHDSGDKHFSSFYNYKVIKGSIGENAGREELKILVDMILSTPQAPRFICRKIYRWFVNSEISKETEKDVIDPLADIFRKNNFEIKPVLSALFKSEHFFDKINYGAQIKNPIDFCIGLQREFNVKYPPQDRYNLNYSMWSFTIGYCNDLGLAFSNPPNVAGWPAYYQAPAYYQLWLNGSVYPKRNEFCDTMIRFGYNREGYFFKPDVLQFANDLKKPEDPDSLINESLNILYRIDISEASKQQLKKDFLLSGQSSDHYWTDAWNDHKKDEKNEQKKDTVENRLKEMYAFILSSAEYQLM